jgi:hypothetical protein
MLRDVSAHGGFLCGKAVVFGAAIKETLRKNRPLFLVGNTITLDRVSIATARCLMWILTSRINTHGPAGAQFLRVQNSLNDTAVGALQPYWRQSVTLPGCKESRTCRNFNWSTYWRVKLRHAYRRRHTTEVFNSYDFYLGWGKANDQGSVCHPYPEQEHVLYPYSRPLQMFVTVRTLPCLVLRSFAVTCIYKFRTVV